MPTGKQGPDDTYGERRPRIVRGETEVIDVGGRKIAVRKAGLGNEASQEIAERLESDYKRMTEDGEADEEPATPTAAPEPGEPGDSEPATGDEPPQEPAAPQATEPAPAEPAPDEPTEPAEPAQPAQAAAQPATEPEEPTADAVTIPRAEYDELKRGSMRQADYTRKTQAHAAEVKNFEAERVAVRAERAEYATLIKQLEDTLKTAQPKEPDWAELRRTLSAEQYIEQREAWQSYEKDLETTRQESARVAEKTTADLRKQHQTRVEAERDKLIALKPELADPAKMRAWLNRLKGTATKLGFTEQEFISAVDHRLFLMLDAVATGGKPGVPGARPVTTKPRVPRSVPPAGPVQARTPQKTVDAARDRMRKEQSVEAVGDYFATLVE